MNKVSLNTVFILLILCFVSCDENRVYEKNMDFKSQQWPSMDTLSFTAHIEDETPLNLYVNVRHRFNYNWRNLWINLGITFPNDSLYETAINIQLSQPDGQWFGDCNGDVCLLKYPLSNYSNYAFADTGFYTFHLNHEMREDPLLEIMSAGIRIENYTAIE